MPSACRLRMMFRSNAANAPINCNRLNASSALPVNVRRSDRTNKTYRPIHLNVDAELLGQLDEYRSLSMPPTKHIHATLGLYIEHLKKRGARKSNWTIPLRSDRRWGSGNGCKSNMKKKQKKRRRGSDVSSFSFSLETVFSCHPCRVDEIPLIVRHDAPEFSTEVTAYTRNWDGRQ